MQPILSFPGSSDGKKSACNSGDLGWIPGSGRAPGEGNGNPLQYSCLEISMDRRAWWPTVHGGCKEADTTERLSLFTHILTKAGFLITLRKILLGLNMTCNRNILSGASHLPASPTWSLKSLSNNPIAQEPFVSELTPSMCELPGMCSTSICIRLCLATPAQYRPDCLQEILHWPVTHSFTVLKSLRRTNVLGTKKNELNRIVILLGKDTKHT